MLKFDELPSVPLNDRIMVRQDEPPEESVGGILIPQAAQIQARTGTILSAGLRAMDIMYDNGDQVHDRIEFGQFAGVWEEWDHIVKAGKKMCPDGVDHAWARRPAPGYRSEAYECDTCGAVRHREPILIMNVGDILTNITKAERLRSGELTLKRYENPTVHKYERANAAPIDTTANPTNGVTYAA